ncbi:hypothetical protein, partial [Shewanella xiamenensis]|uniref:hypothetical protein n=1 Tax=Shewanella xiamenensis TaxID=332186 RepID=UPI0021C0BE4C
FCSLLPHPVFKNNDYLGVTTILTQGDDVVTLNRAAVDKFGGFEEAVWTSAKNEPVIAVCISYIQDNPSISASALGEAVSSKYEMRWTPGSLQRNGNSLRQWALWVNEGINTSSIPTPPGRKK